MVTMGRLAMSLLAMSLLVMSLLVMCLSAMCLSGTLAVSIIPAMAQQAAVQERQLTANGPVKLLSGWACWFADCSFANCHMETTRKPHLGAVRVEVRPTIIPSSGGRCAGRATPGLNITYTPRPGVHGTDEIELHSAADNGQRHVLRYTITVP